MRTVEGNEFNSSGEYFESYVDGSVGVIKLKGGVYDMALNLPLKESFFAKIHQAIRLPEIKVLLVIADDSVFGEDEYIKFDRSLRESTDGRIKLVREENALAQYIRLIYASPKIVVAGVGGSVIGAFLGTILSADYRIASESTIFSFMHIKFETPPQGALGFFLPKYLGLAKTKEILLRGDSIPVTKAREWGLVDDVVPDEGFEKKCIEICEKLAQIPSNVMHFTKHIMKSDANNLEEYFKMEARHK